VQEGAQVTCARRDAGKRERDWTHRLFHCVKRKVPAEVSEEGYTLYQRYQISIRGIEQGSVGMVLPACIGCVSEMLQEEPGTNWTRGETLSP
jgi:hypothetical protein